MNRGLQGDPGGGLGGGGHSCTHGATSSDNASAPPIRAGARVAEEPIRCERGRTKLGAGSIPEFFRAFRWLRLTNRRVLLRYGVADLVGALVSPGSFRVPLGLGPYKLPASPTAIELSIIPNFPMRNHRTFAGRTMIGRKRVRGLKCNAVSLATPIPSRINRGRLSVPFPYAPPVLLRTCAIVPAVVLDRLNFYRAFRDTAPERRRFAATRGSGSG